MKSKSTNLNLPIANPMIITMINCSWIPQLIIIMMIPCRWTFGSTRRLCRPGWLLESPLFSPCPPRSVKSSHVHSGQSSQAMSTQARVKKSWFLLLLIIAFAQTSSINSALPPVAYTKAIDVWQVILFSFIETDEPTKTDETGLYGQMKIPSDLAKVVCITHFIWFFGQIFWCVI